MMMMMTTTMKMVASNSGGGGSDQLFLHHLPSRSPFYSASSQTQRTNNPLFRRARNHLPTCAPFNWTIKIMKINAARNNSAKIWLHDDRRIKLPALDYGWSWLSSSRRSRRKVGLHLQGSNKAWLVDWAGFVEAFSLESLREHKKEVLWPLIARFCCVVWISGPGPRRLIVSG